LAPAETFNRAVDWFDGVPAAERPDQTALWIVDEETLLLYFTSGTTAQPKLVAHPRSSYPVGHLSTMY
jgi:acyl-coenzyme A synthetase/AMP-(fatty) acid ligase